MTDMKLSRPARRDLQSVFGLAKKLSTSFKVKKENFESSYKSILDDDSVIILKAEKDDRIIGYCMGFTHPTFYANGNVAWVEEIYVEEEFRKTGIGKMLMTEFEKLAKEKGCVLCALATRRASEFYKAIGFEESAVYFKKNLCLS